MRRGRLVQQQHRRAQGHGAGDAQALLLATGQAQRALAQLVLHFVPQRALAQRLLDAVGHVGLAQLLVVADAVGHVLDDGHRERHRLLEHHPALAAQAVHRVLRRQDVLAVQQHLTARFQLRVQRVDAVEDAQQGRLAATGRTDQRGHALFRNLQVDALQGVELVVVEVQSTRGQLDRRRRVQALVRGRHGDALHRHGIGKVVHGVIHGKTDQQHEDSQHQGTGPGQHLPGFIRAAGELGHHHRHRGHRLEDVVVPVLVAEGGCR
ncbi:hypothetical protein G6F31_015778 [Rhizopus arrhizus]|nr:hypothetical protein G6F31_015778 [Rhizopus arrhizus]